MEHIGSRIKARRESLNMSQDELAEKMGYKSRSTIAKIEKGVNDVIQSNIIKFADVLKTTPAALMGWDSTEEVERMKQKVFGEDVAAELDEIVEVIDRINKEEGFRKLILQINQLNPEEYNQITNLVNLLITKERS